MPSVPCVTHASRFEHIVGSGAVALRFTSETTEALTLL